MAKFSIERETRIGNAIRAYDERDKVKVAALAREFDVPYTMLRRRILGAGPNRGGSGRLDHAQEKELDDWMISLEAENTPATPGMVEGEANRILARAGVETQVGHNWSYRFIARRPSWRPDLPRPLSALNNSARSKDQIKSKIRKAIELLEEVADDLDKLSPKLRDRVTGALSAGLTEPEEVAQPEDQSREMPARQQRGRKPVSRRVSTSTRGTG
jgi:hypothetical protein